jgi:hypothetical protein
VLSFGDQLQGAAVALFYYAGHGVQLNGANYLVPVEANITREADADFRMLNVNLVLQQMDPADRPGGRLNVVILDACRNNPFGGRGLRSADRGLGIMQAPGGTLISFATQPGAAAQDGDGEHSPFTAALAESIRRPGLGLFDVFNEIGLGVQKATGGTQRPWVSNSPIAGQFYFADLPPLAPQVVVPPPAGPSADDVAWSFLNDTKDAELLRRFIAQYPASPRRREAEARLKAMEQTNVAVTLPVRPVEPTAVVVPPQQFPDGDRWEETEPECSFRTTTREESVGSFMIYKLSETNFDIFLDLDGTKFGTKRQGKPGTCNPWYDDPEGTLQIGNRSFKSKALGTSGCGCSNGICDAGGEKPTLEFVNTTSKKEVSETLRAIMTAGTARFTLTNGPRKGHKLEVSLKNLQIALRHASCSRSLVANF